MEAATAKTESQPKSNGPASAPIGKLPPMLTQYLEYKKQYPDCHLFFQVGDFYELFFEDATTVSRILNLTLTTRDKNDPDPIPMCGVPIAVVDNYLERLVSRGHSVALVSQVDGPLPAKGMVARKLDRVITPGIRIFSATADGASEAVVAAALFRDENDLAIVCSDVQTGRIFVREGLSLAAFAAELLKVGPSELILPRTLQGKPVDRRLAWVREADRVLGSTAIKFRAEPTTDSAREGERNFVALPGYSALTQTAKKAVRMLIQYIDETTLSSQIAISDISVRTYERSMMIDASTRSNLELVRNSRDGGVEGTLFQHLNRTQSPGGAKLLRQWILNPLCDVAQIAARRTAIADLIQAFLVRQRLMTALSRVTDCERIAARLELNVVTPRELGALRDALQQLPHLQACVDEIPHHEASVLPEIRAGLECSPTILATLERFLVDNPPHSIVEGGVIRSGFDPEIDRLRNIKDTGASWILELEAGERSRTGISSLKIKFNNVLGYFIEITKANLAKVPANYIRRQSTVNAERFTTPELREREEEVLGADSRAIQLEKEAFEKLKAELRPSAPLLRTLAFELARLDVLAALADVSSREDYVAPLVDESDEMLITEGRHPILAARLGSGYVPNSLEMRSTNARCLIITGPNMGGKSTYIRQAGMIVILAQMGCFVPAKSARIGIVDKIFARIGASDNMAEGESTFMVEMREASHILSAATARSLLLVDEIGRGTATSDGLAIAQAILEWITLKLRSRTLFATHFHELTGLDAAYPEIENLSVGSVDRDGEVVFTHVICKGAASKSYGIEVAKLAGLPLALVARSRELLSGMEQSQVTRRKRTSQLALFELPPAAVMTEPADYPLLKSLAQRIERLDINTLSPLDALVNLSQIQIDFNEKKQKS